MNRLFILILLILIIFSCKNDKDEESSVLGEMEYTDSFSPKDWENPIAREKIEALDKDIGKVIGRDTINPKLKNIVNLIENFILFAGKKDFNKIKDILTPSAYNSFILRYPDVIINKKYYIRIALPEQIEKERYWLQFKILFPTHSIVSKVEIERNSVGLKLSDFENKFFKDIEAFFK